jgi:hypothetical protein
MYAKLFSSIIASSLWSEDDKTRILFITMLAMADWEGFVEASPAGLAPLARMSLTDCRKALEKLMSPDPDSKNPDNEGRRVAKADGGFQILNYTHFRYKESKEYTRAQTRERVRRYRERKKGNVTQCNAQKRHTDTDTDTIKKKIYKKKSFTPPTLFECRAYNDANNLGVDVETFFHGYNDGGWVDTNGKPVRNWKLKMRTWAKNTPQSKVGEEERLRKERVKRIMKG